MNITELRYLVAIMKWGSVSAAAKQLYAAQPNVSKALKNLEEEYGVRIFERSSTGMIPTEQGKRFIAQAQRVLQQVDELKQEAHQQHSCAELRVVLTHATYASYAAVDFLQQAARSEQLRAHIRESGAIEALDFVLRQGYHMALLRYAAEDEDYYLRYCQRHGLRQEPIMEFSYLLLTSQDSPLAQRQVQNLDELNDYIEVLHGDTHLPGDESTASRWEVNPNRRIHVYERCSQFSIFRTCPRPICGRPPCRSARWSSTIWRCTAARHRSSRCGTCWCTRSGNPCSRRSSCLCSCCTSRRMPPSRTAGGRRFEMRAACALRIFTEGVLPGKRLCALAGNFAAVPKAPSPRRLSP